MKLSDAITYGSTLRGESHSGPFIRVANSDDLLSDVWGAACEAVHSPISKRNWNKDDKLSYDADIEALREIQTKYFAAYFQMPAVCPGAQPRTVAHARGRFTGRVMGGLNELVVGPETHETVQGVTDICPAVTNLAEFVEHAFYVHNWTRTECAQSVEWYEQQSPMLIVQNFEHYRDNAVMKRAARQLTAAAIARHQQRLARRSYFPLH